MEFKGTKGKWATRTAMPTIGENISIGDNMIAVGINADDDKEFMAVAFCGKWGKLEAEMNAQLISKAPEMLEMLKNYLSDLKNIIPQSDARNNRIKNVKQLITEATEL